MKYDWNGLHDVIQYSYYNRTNVKFNACTFPLSTMRRTKWQIHVAISTNITLRISTRQQGSLRFVILVIIFVHYKYCWRVTCAQGITFDQLMQLCNGTVLASNP